VILTVDTVAYGRPATEALARAIHRAKGDGPLVPVTVVVSSNFVGLSLRRLLGSGELGGSGLLNVSFLTPLQLVELLTPVADDRRPPLTNPVLGAAVRQVLAADPGPFRDVAQHPATEAAVARLYAELSHASPATLDALVAAGGMAALSVRLTRQISERLAGFVGEPEIARLVVGRDDLADEAARLGLVVWHLPEPTTPSLERAMARIVDRLPSAVVVGVTGVADADAPVVDLCRRVGIDVGAPSAVDPPVAERLVSVPDPDEEARTAVREVVALAEAGVPLDRVAVLVPTPDPYVRSLEQHLTEAQVPFNSPSRGRLADSVAGRTLLAALALPDQQWRRDQVMALVSGAPVRAADGGSARPVAWENLSREAGVVHGLDDWRRKLAGHRALVADRLARLDPSDPDRAVRLERRVADVEQLDAFVDALAGLVAAVATADGWAAKSAAAEAVLVSLLGIEPRHHVWPEVEQDAFARVLDVLARLATLDELDPRPSRAVFLRALAAELDSGGGRRGRVGQGVLVASLAAAAGQDLDAVVVLGMAEGVCPSLRREDSLLPDAVRALAPAGDLRPRSDRLHDQHRWVLAALAAAPPHRRVLVHPRGSLRGRTPHLPSRWLLDSASARAGRPVDSSEWSRLGAPIIQVVASTAEAVTSSSTPLSVAERDLAELSALAAAQLPLPRHPAVTGSVARGIRCLEARRSPRFTEFDGNLADIDIPSPTEAGHPLSPTGLQEWAACGFRYFLSHVLHVSDRDEPERVHELDARHRGSGVHAVLERFLAEALAQGVPDPQQRWSPGQRARLHQLADEEFDQLERQGRTGRAITWRVERARLHRMLDEFLSVDDAKRAEWSSRPVQVEMAFGIDDVEPVQILLPDGRSVRFRGFADRVDRTDDGRWLVLDYKTGRGTAYRTLDLDPFAGGTTLQLGVYAEAARQLLGGDDAEAYYWMVDQAAGYATYGYPWSLERRQRFVELVAAMVEGIEAGVFPAVPGDYDHFRLTHENCRYCDYDRVCPVQRSSYAEVKVAAPQLAVRARLAPPTDEPDAVGEEAP
jgi:ATP-dependent helicase/nuclease subunit B